MKKIIKIFISILFFSFCAALSAQQNITVDVGDEVYDILENASLRGLCSPLPSVKPYSQRFIKDTLNQILINLGDYTDDYEISSEKNIVERQLERFEAEPGLDLAKAMVRFEGKILELPVSFEIRDSINGDFSMGLYDYDNYSRGAFQVWNEAEFSGDLGNNISYRNQTYLGFTKVPLVYKGAYDIGYWTATRYNSENDFSKPVGQSPRTVNIYHNLAYRPYAYKKYWDGSVYPIEGGINAGGLHAWPNAVSLGFGMKGEIRGYFFNDIIELGAGRENREWGGMDNGASLVLNSTASPFFAFDTALKPFSWISLRAMTGILEMPNRGDVLENAYYPIDGAGKKINISDGNEENINNDEYKDYHYFQNAFSIGQLDLDFKYLHLDFGSTCVWPKRLELGYSFPLIDRIVYQNDIGDYDNLSLYGNLKVRVPGVGSIWGSFYLDELNAFFTKFWETTRAMYAFQVGVKTVIPKIPFGTFSFRYTRIEPYCYTHQSINGTPWYNGYLSENYTNNGLCLGYYLQPNSDEFLARFEFNPARSSSTSLQYQFIRHGADFGSQAVPGSNLYSELPRHGRGELMKHQFHDGAYEWTHIISLNASYRLNKIRVPFYVNASAGYVYDYFTTIDGKAVSIYESDERYSVNEPYHRVENDEYFSTNGVILSIGFKIFGR